MLAPASRSKTGLGKATFCTTRKNQFKEDQFLTSESFLLIFLFLFYHIPLRHFVFPSNIRIPLEDNKTSLENKMRQRRS